jgi:hypothetical protein
MLKHLTAFTVIFSSLLTTVQPAIATATKPYKARCTWVEHGKKPIQQPCIVTGNGGGTGVGFSIEWEDGVKTSIWCGIKKSGCTSEGDRKAEIRNQVVFPGLGFPRVIVLDDLGVIAIDYEKRPVDKIPN